jgi:aspartyl protease family protein
MSEDQSLNIVYLALCLVLVVSALSVRRMSLGLVLRSLLGWAAIGGIIYIAVLYRAELSAMLADVGERIGLDEQRVEGETVRIQMSPDGHFWARVELNGVRRRVLIDSGATLTAVSEATAAEAGIEPDDSGFPVLIETANGTVTARRGNVDRLTLGPLETSDLPVVVATNFGEFDVLGMNFLSRLGSWRVEGRTLVLEPARKDDGGSGSR